MSEIQGSYDLLGEVVRLRALLDDVRRFIDRSLADDYGCPFCKRAGGQYVDGEYWHDDDCLYERLVPRLTGEGERCR
jgi:hypothetical protein